MDTSAVSPPDPTALNMETCSHDNLNQDLAFGCTPAGSGPAVDTPSWDGASHSAQAKLLNAYRKATSDIGAKPSKCVESLLVGIPRASMGQGVHFGPPGGSDGAAISGDQATALVTTLLLGAHGRRGRHPKQLVEPLTSLDISDTGADNGTVRALCLGCWALSGRCALRDLCFSNCKLEGGSDDRNDCMWRIATCRPLCRTLERVFLTGNTQLNCSSKFVWSRLLGRARLSMMCLQDTGMSNCAIHGMCQALASSTEAHNSLRCLRLGPAADANNGHIDNAAFSNILHCIGQLAQLQVLDVKGLTAEQEEALLAEWKLLKPTDVFVDRPQPGEFRISTSKRCHCEVEDIPATVLAYGDVQTAYLGYKEKQPTIPRIAGAVKGKDRSPSPLQPGTPSEDKKRTPFRDIQPCTAAVAVRSDRNGSNANPVDDLRHWDVQPSKSKGQDGTAEAATEKKAPQEYQLSDGELAARKAARRAAKKARRRERKRQQRESLIVVLPALKRSHAPNTPAKTEPAAAAQIQEGVAGEGRQDCLLQPFGLEQKRQDAAPSPARGKGGVANKRPRQRLQRGPRPGDKRKGTRGVCIRTKAKAPKPRVLDEKLFGPPPGGRVFVAKRGSGRSIGASDLQGYVSDNFVRPDDELVYTTSADDLDVCKDWDHLGREGLLDSDCTSSDGDTLLVTRRGRRRLGEKKRRASDGRFDAKSCPLPPMKRKGLR
ncbi:unnamed protein product [Ostreobium quekettii]|uniref:Leucine-rich repeat n=1 Tax=Ostreobium quekettii TaxID=121088 RepID=A0A8S1JH48_9CHLO|nr:unnamed protein product [Ostreobium quekettii]|eukprot:evm.model.scf_281.9 EVM.evm.TU.scf_281.9   scf_281:75629-79840(-)